MHVLHLAPLWFPIGQDSLGGIETFLAGLLRALHRAGCRNTLIATGDSRTPADLVPVVSPSLFSQMGAGTALEYAHYEQAQILLALERAPGADIVHSHLGPHGLFLSGVSGPPVLHTWHTQVYVDMAWFVRRYPDVWLCAVSEFQARPLREAGATRCAVIHNGVDVSAFPSDTAGGPGLLYLGRMEEPKGVDLAIRAAQALGRPLTLAGPIVDRAYFDGEIVPHLDDQIEYVGTVDHRAKTELMSHAACVLMPSRVPEAFGVVAVEAMACGTPVVGLASGALPELIEPDVTGYLADVPGELAELTSRAVKLDRRVVRERAAGRFDVNGVASRYLDLYRTMGGGGSPRETVGHRATAG